MQPPRRRGHGRRLLSPWSLRQAVACLPPPVLGVARKPPPVTVLAPRRHVCGCSVQSPVLLPRMLPLVRCHLAPPARPGSCCRVRRLTRANHRAAPTCSCGARGASLPSPTHSFPDLLPCHCALQPTICCGCAARAAAIRLLCRRDHYGPTNLSTRTLAAQLSWLSCAIPLLVPIFEAHTQWHTPRMARAS